MAREHYEALIREFPGMYALNAWVDDFYDSIEKLKEKGYRSGQDYYIAADGRFNQICGFIEAMKEFGKIDKERMLLLKEEFLQAIKGALT